MARRSACSKKGGDRVCMLFNPVAPPRSLFRRRLRLDTAPRTAHSFLSLSSLNSSAWPPPPLMSLQSLPLLSPPTASRALPNATRRGPVQVIANCTMAYLTNHLKKVITCLLKCFLSEQQGCSQKSHAAIVVDGNMASSSPFPLHFCLLVWVGSGVQAILPPM